MAASELQVAFPGEAAFVTLPPKEDKPMPAAEQEDGDPEASEPSFQLPQQGGAWRLALLAQSAGLPQGSLQHRTAKHTVRTLRRDRRS